MVQIKNRSFILTTVGPLTSEQITLIVQGIIANKGPDLELRGGETISSPGDSIVSLDSPKKSYTLNSLGGPLFWPRPFPYGQNCNF